MKPFNLTQALAGRPVITRSGRKVLWIAHDPGAHADARVIGRIEDNPYHTEWNEQGQCCGFTANLDLFMVAMKKKGWINLHVAPTGLPFVTGAWPSEADARQGSTAALGYITTIPIEWEE